MAAQRQSEKVPKNISPQNSFPKAVFFPLLTPPLYHICTRGDSMNGKKETKAQGSIMCFKKDQG